MTLCQEVIHTGWVNGLKSVRSRRHGAAYDTEIECWEARGHDTSQSWLCCLLIVRSRQLSICSEPVSPSVKHAAQHPFRRTEGGWNKNVSSCLSCLPLLKAMQSVFQLPSLSSPATGKFQPSRQQRTSLPSSSLLRCSSISFCDLHVAGSPVSLDADLVSPEEPPLSPQVVPISHCLLEISPTGTSTQPIPSPNHSCPAPTPGLPNLLSQKAGVRSSSLPQSLNLVTSTSQRTCPPKALPTAYSPCPHLPPRSALAALLLALA